MSNLKCPCCGAEQDPERDLSKAIYLPAHLRISGVVRLAAWMSGTRLLGECCLKYSGSK